MFPQTPAAAASGRTRPCLGYTVDGAKQRGNGDAWLWAGTRERLESIRLMFGDDNVMDAAAAAAAAGARGRDECGHGHNSGSCLFKSKWRL